MSKILKMRLLTAAILILWVACGYVNYGYTLRFFTHRFPEQYHMDIAIAMAIGGPFAMPAVFLGNEGEYHWRTTPLTRTERWEIFHMRYPLLTQQDFDDEN